MLRGYVNYRLNYLKLDLQIAEEDKELSAVESCKLQITLLEEILSVIDEYEGMLNAPARD